MQCSQCGYVSFDHLEACKKCGATLHGGRRRHGLPLFATPPEGQSAAPATLPGATSAATPGPGRENQLQDIEALFAGSSDSSSPQLASRSESQEKAHFSLPMNSLPAPITSPAGTASLDTVDAEPAVAARVEEVRQAGFCIRTAAWMADTLLLILPVFIAAFLVWATIILGGWLGGEINDQVKDFAAISGAAIVIASGLLYFTLFVGACGQTPGKMLLGLKIVDADGQAMTYGRAFLRSLCWILSLLLFSVGFLMIALTRDKRGLHDLLAGTRVIRVQRPG